MSESGGSLFALEPTPTVSKRGFAEAIGVSQPRVSQLIAAGLPVEKNGRIHLDVGKAWVAANIDPNRRRANLDDVAADDDGGPVMSPRAKRDTHEAEIARLKAEKLAGRLIDRRATLRAIEGRAKAERDALIGWVNRVAPMIAAAVNGDLSIVTTVLDREVREHLVAMANTPLEIK